MMKGLLFGGTAPDNKSSPRLRLRGRRRQDQDRRAGAALRRAVGVWRTYQARRAARRRRVSESFKAMGYDLVLVPHDDQAKRELGAYTAWQERMMNRPTVKKTVDAE